MKTENAACEICGKKFGDQKSLAQHIEAKHSKEEKQFRQKKASRSTKKIGLYLGIGVAIIGILYVFFLATQVAPTGIGPVGEIHIHFPLKVVINGEQYNFEQPQFIERNHATHFHSGAADKIHVHARGVTVDYFLKSIGINISNGCMEFNKATYCTATGKKLSLLINGQEKQEQEFKNFVLSNDGDTVSIIYG